MAKEITFGKKENVSHETQETFVNRPENVFCSEKTNAGINYGPYCFPTSIGVTQSFVGWLCNKRHPYGRMLSKAYAGTREFSCCWKYITIEDPIEFISLQHEFVKMNYFIPTIEFLENEFLLKISETCEDLQHLIWTLAVELGPQNTKKLFKMIQTDMHDVKISKMDESMIISFIKDITSSDDWQNAKEQFSSGLSIPQNDVSFIYKAHYKQASA